MLINFGTFSVFTQELKDQIESKLISDKVLDWLAEQAEITYIEPQLPEVKET